MRLGAAPERGLLDPIEIASRDEIVALQTRRLAATLRRVYDNVAADARQIRRAWRASRRFPRSRRSRAVFPSPTKADLRANYPFGLFAVPRTDRWSASTLHRARRASRRWSATPAAIIEMWSERHRAHHPRRRRALGHDRAYRLRLRPLHRRARLSLRRRAARLHGRAGLGRHDGAAGAADLRLRARHPDGDAFLRARHRRRVSRAGARPARLGAEARLFRRRALDRRRCAPRSRTPSISTRSTLRPLRGDRSGRRRRMRRDQGRAPCLGGSFLSRGDRPGDAAPCCPMARSASSSSPRSPRRRCRSSATAPAI